MSVAARYYDVGRLAGEQAEKILVDGISAGELPVAQMTNFAIVINMDVAKKLRLFPPIDLLQIAETVRSEEHTSELQSLMRISYAVFCLKKKNTLFKQKTH